jgi:hypothetical protein
MFMEGDLDSLAIGVPIPVVGIAGSFNPDTAILRRLGEDPFLAERLKFMKETRAIRFKMFEEIAKRFSSSCGTNHGAIRMALLSDNPSSALFATRFLATLRLPTLQRSSTS